MEKSFFAGLLIGMVGGALIVANNYKARTLVKKGQDELMEKMDAMMDEKIKAMGNSSQQQEGGDNSSNQGQKQNG